MLRFHASSLLASLALFAAATSLASVTASATEKAMGWASQNGGTTGGAGGTEVTVTTMADLQKYAKMSGKYVIMVKGTMGSYGTRGEGNGDRVVVTADKSILGQPGALVKGGFDIKGVKNIILRNLTIQGPGACDNSCGSAGEGRQDNITIVSGATNIWLDHLSIIDGEDGNTDVTKSSDFVTISWCKFSYTNNSYASGTTGYSHRFSNLFGGDDKEGSEGKLSITLYKTWWGDGVAERMPRARFGKIHVANCLFTSKDPGQSHCVRAAYLANLLIESNAFIGQKKPIDLYNGDYTAVTVKNNLFSGCSGNTVGDKTAFTPPYTLSLSGTANLQSEVSDANSGAGPTLVWGNVSVEEKANRVLSNVVMEHHDGRDVLVNSADRDVVVSLRDLVGRRVLDDTKLAKGASLTLPAATGVRVLKMTGGELSRSFLLSGTR